MTLFSEVDWAGFAGGRIAALDPTGLAAQLGLLPGDELLAINDNPVEDVIDVHYYSAEEAFELLVRRGDEYLLFEAERDYNEPLGIEFAHPTFDVDIRRCNNLCEFCFVLQMAPRFRRTLYIKDDDYRYSFLFGHFVTLTNLREHDWWRIETMGLSPLYVSVHVTETEMRRRFLRNAEAPDIMAQLRWLAERGIAMHTQLVIVPQFNDGEWLERSIDELAALGDAVLSVSVVPVGLTRHHKYGMRPHIPAEAQAMLAYLDGRQVEFKERLGRRFVYPTDEWYLVSGRPVPPREAYDGLQLQENGLGMVRDFLDEWQQVKVEIGALPSNSAAAVRPRFASATLATAKLFAPTLAEGAAELAAMTGADIEVRPVVNEQLGETITVAGLLMAGDILAQLKAAGYGELVVLPRVTFDHPDRISLDDLTPQHLADELGVPVALADWMGDVWDALTGVSAVLYEPSRWPS